MAMANDRAGLQQNAPGQNSSRRIETPADARRELAKFVRDPREADRKAGEIVAAGRILARHMRGDTRTRERIFHDYFGASAKTFAEDGSRVPVENRFTELLVASLSHDLSTDRERLVEEKRDRLDTLLEQLREDVLQIRSSPSAQRAHIEADSYNQVSDDLRELFEAPEDRTRAEHADHLSRTNKLERDLYERGAGLYGDVLIIPAEAHSRESSSDDIRIGSIEHAVDRFSRFITDGDELARKAQEFVELGRQIAGRTADSGMRLAVFQTYYKEISYETNEETFSQPDGSHVTFRTNSRRRLPEEQKAQLDLTLERMRDVAGAMRELEWTIERGESIEIGEWEESLSARERAAENETVGYTRIDNREDHEPSHEDERADISGFSMSNHHESVRLDGMPPRPPLDLADEERQWLRGVMLPQVDRQLETGARPAEIIRGLSIAERTDERRWRDELVHEIFLTRSPDADHDHGVSRDEELRALFTLRALALAAREEEKGERAGFTHRTGRAAHYGRALASINAQIEERRPTATERAAALDAVHSRAASALAFEMRRLASFEGAEREIAEIDRRKELHQAQVRQSPAWLFAKEEAEAVRRDALLDAKEQLIRSNSTRFSVTSPSAEREGLTPFTQAAALPNSDGNRSSHEASRYPELTGDTAFFSRFVEAQQSGAALQRAARAKLMALVETPELDRERAELEEQLATHVSYYRAATGLEINNSTEARVMAAPHLDSLVLIIERTAGERARIPEIPFGSPAPGKGGQESRATNPVFVAISDKTRARLPVGSFNEYQTLMRAASGIGMDGKDKTEIAVHVFSGLYRDPVSGRSEERAASYTYLKEYVAYRQQDESTRMLNRSRLYRDFNGRLDAARSIDELRQTANAIRKENYDRDKHPERYGDERRETRRKGEQAKHPLSETEMKKLFLSLAPEHYTDEMRRFRLDKAGTGREREERIKELAAGRAAPSASLDKLLAEFGKVRTWKDVRAYTVQLLNPPEQLPERLPRFSRVNLYAEHESLAPAERDYLFRTISEQREKLKAGISVRAEERTSRALRERMAEKEPAKSLPALREVPRASGSFRAYTAAATWREAEFITQFIHEHNAHARTLPVNAVGDDTRSTVVQGISDRNLQAATTILKEFKPALVKLVAGEFKNSSDREMRQVGEVLTTFQELKREQMAGGSVEYRITTPERSDIPPASWERLLTHLQPQLSEDSSHRARIPDDRRRALRREALSQAWTVVAPGELRGLEKILDATPILLSRALEVREQLAHAGRLQTQARYADDLVREVVADVSLKAERALREERVPVVSERQLLRELAASALESTLSQRAGSNSSTLRTSVGAIDSESVYRSGDLEHARQVVISSITSHDRLRYGQLAAYALATRDEYLANFTSIDERTLELARTREGSRSIIGGERELEVNTQARDSQSAVMQQYQAARQGFERKALAEELRRMLDDPQSDIAARVAELSRDATKRVRDVVPGERAAAIGMEASREAWWQLMPPELLNRETDRELTLSPQLESAALRVSRAIRTAQLIERGIQASRQEEAQLSLTGDADVALARGFADIDHARASLAAAREVDGSEQRFGTFSRIRGEMERDVSSYLKEVLQGHGENAFTPGEGSAYHTQMTTSIIKEAFARHGIEPETLNLNDSRIEEIAGTIVSSLPREFAQIREQNNRLGQLVRSEQEQETLRVEHALNRNMAPSDRAPAQIERTYGHHHGDGETLNLEEQFIEQKVANQLEHAQETPSHATSSTSHTLAREQRPAHQLDEVAEIAKPKEHVRQHVLAR